MATIKEIAKLAGISRGTVDRVLNNRGAVNKETEKKILDIAKQLDYRPNKAGIVLAAPKKKLKLGVVIFSTENPFFQYVLNGVNETSATLKDYNCSVIVKEVPYDIELQLQALKELVAEGVAGIAVAPCNHESIRNYINELFEMGIPVVTLNTDIKDSSRIAYVGSHYVLSGQTAAGLMNLVTLGNAKIGIISGSPDILCHTERIAGFVDVIQRDYSSLSFTEVLHAHDNNEESYEKTLQLLEKHPDITAMFYAAGGIIGGCNAIKKVGLDRKLKIIGFDINEEIQSLLEEGTITAMICQQPHLQGSRPLNILFDYLTAGEMPKCKHQYMGVDIRIKENAYEL